MMIAPRLTKALVHERQSATGSTDYRAQTKSQVWHS